MTEPERYRPLSYLEANAARRPDAPAVYDGDEIISFSELLERVRGTMYFLRQLGLGPGQVAAVSLPNTWQYVALEIALPALGAVIMPLAPSLGAYEVESALRRSRSALVVVDAYASELVSAMVPGLPELSSVVDVSDLDLAASSFDRAEAAYPTEPSDIVQIALTSGTTGLPKLASLSAELKQLTFEGYTSRLAISQGDRVLPLSPISQGVGEMSLYALRTGASLVMVGERRFSAGRDLKLAAASRATVLSAVPTMIGRLFHYPDFPETDLSALRVTAVAGSPMPPDLAESWEKATKAPLCGFYGAMDIGQLAVASPTDPPARRWHSVGRPHERAELLVCDSEGRPVAPGEHGEICMRGPLVQHHYFGEANGPYSKDGWAHFGDLGYLDELGYLHIVGRTKDTIIRGGDNINPYQVEAVLTKHPDIAEACVVGAPDSDLGERPVAFVVVKEGAEISLSSAQAHLDSEGLAHYKWPELLVVVKELPLGSSGKVSRRELQERAGSELSSSTSRKDRDASAVQ